MIWRIHPYFFLTSFLPACGLFSPPAVPPSPPTDAELQASCDAVQFDLDDCYELARRQLARGEVAEAVDPLAFACTKYGTACVELGTLYLRGAPGLPRDLEKGFQYAGKACSGANLDYRGCSWDVLRQLSQDDERLIWRNAVEAGAFYSCRYATSHGWGCFNYGVGLSCGLFYDKDVAYARHVLDRGCRLGDSRACKLSIQLRDHPEKPVSCELIGPDPDVPVDLSLHVEPLPADAVWPEGEERHQRKPMP